MRAHGGAAWLGWADVVAVEEGGKGSAERLAGGGAVRVLVCVCRLLVWVSSLDLFLSVSPKMRLWRGRACVYPWYLRGRGWDTG